MLEYQAGSIGTDPYEDPYGLAAVVRARQETARVQARKTISRAAILDAVRAGRLSMWILQLTEFDRNVALRYGGFADIERIVPAYVTERVTEINAETSRRTAYRSRLGLPRYRRFRPLSRPVTRPPVRGPCDRTPVSCRSRRRGLRP